jgi:hypothetical protein
VIDDTDGAKSESWYLWLSTGEGFDGGGRSGVGSWYRIHLVDDGHDGF